MDARPNIFEPSHSQCRLVLLEGMPGTGKSSVSQAIYRDLLALGVPARWLHEESEHQLQLFFDPDRHTPWRAYLAEVIDRWQAFASEVSNGNEVIVVDSAVLQNHFRSLLIFDIDQEAVFETASAIEGIAADLFPRWIYLSPRDITAHFESIIKVRGQRMLDLWIEAHDRYPFTTNAGLSGHAGFIAFWRQFDAITTKVFDDVEQSKLRVEVDANSRNATLDSLRAFLGLSATTMALPSSELEAFAGLYTSKRDVEDKTIEIVAADGCLIALTESPTIDVAGGPLGCFRQVRLLPVTQALFVTEGWPYEVRFETTRDGDDLLRLSPTKGAWNPISETYVKCH